jgi:glycine cleavage system H protein
MKLRFDASCRYTREHEWIRLEGNRGYVGISDYAQHAMGDVVFVELPEVGASFETGDDFCVVESVKGANDVYAPVGCTVLEVNASLEDEPEKVNQEPYESWIAQVEVADPAEVEDLMDKDAYEAYCASLEEA